jgi:predicted nucleic acid-binding protein
MSFLSRFKTEPVTQDIVDDADELYRRWHPTHGIDVNDAMLAAIVAATGGKIYTQNRKHYALNGAFREVPPCAPARAG